MPQKLEVNPRATIIALARKLKISDEQLVCAQNVASAILADASNHCAITLSSLLVFNQLYPIGIYKGNANFEASALALAADLKARGWQAINVGDIGNQPIQAGDVGVVDDGRGTHHIYLIIDATSQITPIIADNQAPPHARPIAGGQMPGVGSATATKYFLRAPDTTTQLRFLRQLTA